MKRNLIHLTICAATLWSAYHIGIQITLWLVAIIVSNWLLARRYPWVKVGWIWFLQGVVSGLSGQRRGRRW